MTVDEKNQERVEDVIHRFIGSGARHQRCSSDWRSARDTMRDPAQRQKLLDALRTLK